MIDSDSGHYGPTHSDSGHCGLTHSDDKSSSFNAILGRTWIHAMKALPSSNHQMLSFKLHRVRLT